MPYQTCNTAIAATLLCFNYNLVKVDRSDMKKVVFSFEHHDDPNGEEARRIATAYYNQDLEVVPFIFFNHLKDLKTRIHQQL